MVRKLAVALAVVLMAAAATPAAAAAAPVDSARIAPAKVAVSHSDGIPFTFAITSDVRWNVPGSTRYEWRVNGVLGGTARTYASTSRAEIDLVAVFAPTDSRLSPLAISQMVRGMAPVASTRTYAYNDAVSGTEWHPIVKSHRITSATQRVKVGTWVYAAVGWVSSTGTGRSLHVRSALQYYARGVWHTVHG